MLLWTRDSICARECNQSNPKLIKSEHGSRVINIRTHVLNQSICELFEATLSVVVSINRFESCLCEVGFDNANVFKDLAILLGIEISVVIDVHRLKSCRG